MMPERSADLSLQRRPFGSWLLGPADQSPPKLRIRVQSLLSVLSIVTNLIGASVVFVLAVFVLPGPPSDARLTVVRAVVVPAYFVVAMVVGSIWSALLALRVTKWVLEDRPATQREQIATLRLPLQLTLIEVVLWLIATVFFSILAAILQPASLPHILVTLLCCRSSRSARSRPGHSPTIHRRSGYWRPAWRHAPCCSGPSARVSRSSV
jgi:adenylate cyclase